LVVQPNNTITVVAHAATTSENLLPKSLGATFRKLFHLRRYKKKQIFWFFQTLFSILRFGVFKDFTERLDVQI
jgi:hypothetical protein